MKLKPLQIIGLVGLFSSIIIYAIEPSFPTPDKLFVFLLFAFMVFRLTKSYIKHIAPFVGLILIYESFRSIVPKLNGHVEYMWMPRVDNWLFGTLPTAKLQHWLWHGQVQWYDLLIYLVYMLHFVIPIGLLLLIWRYREKHYWQAVSCYITVSFAGFFTYLLFPAAPPWMASQKGLIEPITRISSEVWNVLGIQDFPSFYNNISPNPVAAVPSLHAAFATLFTLLIFSLFGKKWGVLSLIYPFIIYFGTVYQGEHYAIDEILGAIYAVVSYLVVYLIFKNKVWNSLEIEPVPVLNKKTRSANKKQTDRAA